MQYVARSKIHTGVLLLTNVCYNYFLCDFTVSKCRVVAKARGWQLKGSYAPAEEERAVPYLGTSQLFSAHALVGMLHVAPAPCTVHHSRLASAPGGPALRRILFTTNVFHCLIACLLACLLPNPPKSPEDSWDVLGVVATKADQFALLALSSNHLCTEVLTSSNKMRKQMHRERERE